MLIPLIINREGNRWSQFGPDAQLLQQLLESGTIPRGMPAARIQQLYPPFAQYQNPPFATNLRRLRDRLGLLPPKRDTTANSTMQQPPPPVMYQQPANTMAPQMMQHQNQRQTMQMQPLVNTPSPGK